jgi:hypothetical protein
MSHTDHDDRVNADPSPSRAEPPPKQARPMTGPTLIARSRQSTWPLFVLVPAAALLVWMTGQTWSPSFDAEGRIAYLNDIPAGVRAAFFLGSALVCVGCIGIMLWRRLWPRVELIVDDHSVTSKLFWGPGTLRWSAITHLTRQNNWLVRARNEAGRTQAPADRQSLATRPGAVSHPRGHRGPAPRPRMSRATFANGLKVSRKSARRCRRRWNGWPQTDAHLATTSSLRGRRPCETSISCTAADTRLGIAFP